MLEKTKAKKGGKILKSVSIIKINKLFLPAQLEVDDELVMVCSYI